MRLRLLLFAVAISLCSVTMYAATPPEVPPGAIVAFAGKVTNPPAGWLVCDGRALAVKDFKALFKVIGTIYGGDGVNKFNLPDLQGRVVVGAGAGSGLSPRPLAQRDGEETHTLTIGEMPSHAHGQTLDDNTGAQGGTNQTDGNGGGETTGINNGRTRREGGGAPHNNMQPFVVLNYLIHT